ncbi:YbdK family carboxylate-amine ligase [Legionella micdadei]|uniref:Putative glutamate--cysteine ligase 2 n=1 Tax=Legionella micdadei TaxID=451 RepID=A0A098GGK6_LEGMI|nr:YbdK family carboxylate-amine ligase [Legionella micdadei]ARG97405.1 glutamate--cysteine ligase [Legionella micdadei]KTD28296.1 carboxylate-amine ligase [Legionella micdadei]NSL16923.1 glutamate--cysteine ligase [Legionella micdadei]CEG61115.1 Carboxylate-amine ligase LPC_0414 [Legionella micdadei]SCY30617.1 carboxylate-amine ligase [Legionella micdadei]
MRTLAFRRSSAVSLGIELELQIIDSHSYALASRSKDLIRSIREHPYQKQIKPEITQSMIEINSSIHHSVNDLLEELYILQAELLNLASRVNVLFCGGGTHPFHRWSLQKIFPTKRYKNLSRHYRYLSKRSTVFGEHIHIGCAHREDAIYLTHALARYVPHFIAICASSPFYQGIDTGFYSSRSTVFNAFPLSGVMPYLTNWKEFSTYFYKLKGLGIVESMKDFYWDIRPKPEFGTVEIRVCDTPLTLRKAVAIAAYLQALSLHLIEEKPDKIERELYYVYNYNRFQASRYGFDGQIIDPFASTRRLIKDEILETIKKIEPYANQLNSMDYISEIAQEISNKNNDVVLLRQLLKQHNSYPKVVAEQCKIWTN